MNLQNPTTSAQTYTADPTAPPEGERGRQQSTSGDTPSQTISWSDRDAHRQNRPSLQERKRSRSVSIDRGIQSQKEGEDAVNIIKNCNNGIGLWAFLRVMHRQPGFMVDIKEIARYITIEQDRMNIKNCKTNSSRPIPTAPPETDKNPTEKEKYVTITPANIMTNQTNPQEREPTNYSQYMQSIWDTPIHRQQQIHENRLEMRQTPWSQGCIQSPVQFIAGNESITNNDRLKTVKTHFTFAWGPKKFTGRKGYQNEEASIMNLLHHFNLAQHQCPVTEQEFVALLCKSTAEEALRIMSDNLDKHAKGQMTVQQIYDNMTDIFFDDLRPGTASTRLRELTENHHPFHSMNEANIEISRLSCLAAKTSKTRERQEPVAADKYLKTFMKILPKEFKPVAITLLDAKTQKIKRDLDPPRLHGRTGTNKGKH